MRPVAVAAIALMVSVVLSTDAITRSESARRYFKKLNPCPTTQKFSGPCPGYVIDHVVPLACGGTDAPWNMQWQTVDEAKIKDRWERKGCKKN